MDGYTLSRARTIVIPVSDIPELLLQANLHKKDPITSTDEGYSINSQPGEQSLEVQYFFMHAVMTNMVISLTKLKEHLG